jgi:hypothetical protein
VSCVFAPVTLRQVVHQRAHCDRVRRRDGVEVSRPPGDRRGRS